MRYAIEGFTGDTSGATDEKIAKLRDELEKRVVAVTSVGRDRIEGVDALVMRFVIDGESDADAKREAKKTIEDVLGPGHGWAVSPVQPWHDGMGANPFDR
jgi:hypothetical protein